MMEIELDARDPLSIIYHKVVEVGDNQQALSDSLRAELSSIKERITRIEERGKRVEDVSTRVDRIEQHDLPSLSNRLHKAEKEIYSIQKATSWGWRLIVGFPSILVLLGLTLAYVLPPWRIYEKRDIAPVKAEITEMKKQLGLPISKAAERAAEQQASGE